MAQAESLPKFQFTGGALCLDFANTVDNRTSSQPLDLLRSRRDLVAWMQQAGILGSADLAPFGQEGIADADRVLQDAVSLREAIYTIFSALSAGRRAPSAALKILNHAVRDAGSHRALAPGSEGFDWKWVTSPGSPGWFLWPIAQSAAELLTSGELSRLRECGAETCGWLFMDRSKSHNRRWCEMKSCGNRNKARRHYQRMKSQ